MAISIENYCDQNNVFLDVDKCHYITPLVQHVTSSASVPTLTLEAILHRYMLNETTVR